MVKTLVAIILCLSFVAPVFAAAPVQPQPAATQIKPAKPDWSQLTPAQQAVLNQFDAMPTMRDSLPDTLTAMLTGLWEQLETPATGRQKPPAQGPRT